MFAKGLNNRMKSLRFKFLCFVIILCTSLTSSAGDVVGGKYPNLNVSWGLMNYRGDLSEVITIGNFYNPTFGMEFNANYIIKNTIGVEVFSQFGSMVHEQNTIDRTHNFKTTIMGGGLNVSFHFDNGFIMKKGSKMAPFSFVGVMPFSYYVSNDYKDANGNIYHYWTDGTIRNLDEKSVGASSAVIIQRDFVYERNLRGVKGFSTMDLAFHAGFGMKFHVNDWLKAQMRISYSFTRTDNLDGLSKGKGKDGYVFGNFGFTIDPNVLIERKKNKENEVPEDEGEDIDVDEYLTMDTDGDGIPDLDDKCSGTASGVTVGKDGCPEDEKEKKSSVEVDSLAMMSDSLIVIRKTLCERYPMLCGENDNEYPEVNERSKLGKKKTKKVVKKDNVSSDDIQRIVDIADENKDGKVSMTELYKAIEEFFDTDDKLTLSELRQLIDHFFDQY